MDRQRTIDGDVVDLECGMSSLMQPQEGANEMGSSSGQEKNALNRESGGFVGINELYGEQVPNITELPVTHAHSNSGASLNRREGEEKQSLFKLGAEKIKKTRCKKPPKPPRPPTSTPLDATDLKMIREISELAMMKRARIERMKNKKKNAKSSSSNGNLCAMVVTIIFCLLLIWQGALSWGNSNTNHHGSPQSSIRVDGGFISLQFDKDASVNGLDMPHSASPTNVGPITN
ncbi:uncharacterized protein LOC121991690 [Zingiber officinale]|uniref:uncharacterized protein LOC121991690 n=1 Tax=Zingiber officinale TaxID=94328 RepID=UPI001C4C657C|nr:uncharacterized protein LOC121991690 [Zingiber officinale]XP_042401630.1 uncharacterized protein LOC121991690 [Zingiber officinale]XP_042401631.1 uncharacterized protein LOC121991690 [Zingiber officinale]